MDAVQAEKQNPALGRFRGAQGCPILIAARQSRKPRERFADGAGFPEVSLDPPSESALPKTDRPQSANDLDGENGLIGWDDASSTVSGPTVAPIKRGDPEAARRDAHGPRKAYNYQTRFHGCRRRPRGVAHSVSADGLSAPCSANIRDVGIVRVTGGARASHESQARFAFR